jgi:hypothetical protein
MKTIKSLGIFLLLALLSVGFNSCGDDYKSRLKELIIKDTWEFNSGADTQSLVLRNEDLSNYIISSNENWCAPKIDYDASTIYVSVYERGYDSVADLVYDEDPYSDRTCTVTITDVRDNTVRSFKVLQKQLNEIKVNGSEYEVPSAGGDVEIELQHNVTPIISIPDDVTWIEMKSAGTRALVTSKVTLTINANNSGGARSAAVTIKSEDGSIQKKIYISQRFTPKYSFEKTEFTVDELAQTINVKFTANFKFEIVDDEWVKKGGRETVDDTTFIQKLNISAFTEKKASRATTFDFTATVLKQTRPDYSEDIIQSIKITQNRTLYIPKDSVTLMLGDSTVIDVVNTKKRDLVWSSSDEKEFTVDSKGKVKCISTDGDGLATITVKSADGQYSDQIIAVASKPKDMTKYLVCKWDSTQTIKEGVSSTILTFKVTNTSKEAITLTGYTAYKDSTSTAKWFEETLSETLANGSRTINLGAIPTTNYYMTLRYTYLNEKYVLGYSKKGVMTIKKETTTPAAATRRSARSRRR